MLRSSETFAGQAFIERAVSEKFGNVTNINSFYRNGANMFCFVTFWCEAK